MLNCCPPDPDETAEAMVMGTLRDEEASLFAWHVAHCVKCRRLVALNLRYVPAMKVAAKTYADRNTSNDNGLKTAGAAGV